MYTPLATLARDVRVSDGRYTVDPTAHQCTGAACDYEIGLLEVVLHDNAIPALYK